MPGAACFDRHAASARVSWRLLTGFTGVGEGSLWSAVLAALSDPRDRKNVAGAVLERSEARDALLIDDLRDRVSNGSEAFVGLILIH